MTFRPVFLLSLLALLASPAFCGDSQRTVRAARVLEAPRLDGVLADQVWAGAQPAADFTQRDPLDGQPASEPTEVRVLYDDAALYFGWMFHDAQPEAIVARLARRDDEVESDRGSIRIDSFHDGRTAFEFTFNAAGVKVDIIQFDDADREDASWDVVWDVHTAILPDGWSAEVKIPFSALRYAASDDTAEQAWGINFIRHITRSNETDYWAHVPKHESGFVSRFGHLTGLRGLPRAHTTELLPFAVGSVHRAPGTDVLEPDRGARASAGLDLKHPLSNNMTLDVTVNPDFGQVEADPAVLNLTTFETFYPERRPFFIEGTQIMLFSTFGDEGGGPGLFYSRRIGRAISTDDVDVPEGSRIRSLPSNVRIIGAAKFTGRSAAGLSVGALQAVTRREFAEVVGADGASSLVEVEPLASYSVLRLRQEVLDGSSVGLIATGVGMDGHTPAFTGGADWGLRLEDNTYRLDGFAAFSSTARDASARQEGSAGRIELSRLAAVHWLWSISADYTTPRYNINDVGFFRRPNDFGGFGSLMYKEDIPRGMLRNYRLALNLHERWNFDRANLIRQAGLSAEVLFENYWDLEAAASADVGLYDDRETRGNGLYRRPALYQAVTEVSTDSRRALSAYLGYLFLWDSGERRQHRLEVGLEIRPTHWMEWDLEVGYEPVRNQEAWVENVETADGTLSVFGSRSTDQLDIRLRGGVTFSRDFTLQLYGQLFSARGRYENFRRLVGTSEFEPYAYPENPDFSERSFLLNTVFRWEYSPGSTLFLVWSQSRQGESATAGSLEGELEDTFQTPPANVLLLKVSYWFTL